MDRCPEDFPVLKVLAKSGSCWVCLAVHHSSGMRVVLKIFHHQRLHPVTRFQMQREVEIHSSCDHPNIIKLVRSALSPRAARHT